MSSKHLSRHYANKNLLLRLYSSKRYESTSSSVTIEANPEEPFRPKKTAKVVSPEDKKSHKVKIKNFFQKSPHLAAVKKHIPENYLALKRVTPPDNLYLIDSTVAKQAASYVIPSVRKNHDQIICETNAGLGLITSELLESGIKLVRLYEGCGEFKEYLKEKFKDFEGRIELFSKDIFLLHRYAYIDKQDNGSRVEQLLQGVPRKNWDDGPVMTIIGSFPNMNFVRFLMKSLVLQNFVVSLGRIQLYVFMRPRDFIVLTAGPHLNLHTYQRSSVIFNLFFNYELLEKFPREVFLPWQSLKSQQIRRYPGQIDNDQMYFVKINFKRNLPVAADNLLPFYSFVNQFFGRGTTKVIPVLEKWVPGCGLDIMLPKLKHKDYFKNMNIFTQFGELTPQQILSVFEETINHPHYEKSHFMNMIESHLAKTETIESCLDYNMPEKTADTSDTDHTL